MMRMEEANHWDNQFSKWNGIHLNGIENFWSYKKEGLINLTESE